MSALRRAHEQVWLDEEAKEAAGMLLTNAEAAAIVGTPTMEAGPVVPAFFWVEEGKNPVDPPDCVGAVFIAMDTVNTSASGVRWQDFHSPDENHFAVQAIILFSTPERARAVLDSSAKEWQQCANKTVRINAQTTRDEVLFGDVYTNVSDHQIAQLRTAKDPSNDWRCQHVMRAHDNLLIEAQVCGTAVTDDAARVADAIAEKAR